MTPEQKQQLTITLFGVVSLLIILLAFLQMRNNLYAPFSKQTPPLARGGVNAATGLDADALRLKSQDTDQDGLSDYEELNQYRTSAYLKDSDGDGLDDKTEVVGKTDPNCPKGRGCGISSDQQGATNNQLTPTSILPLGSGGGNFSPLPGRGEQEGGSPIDYIQQAAVIRQLLVKAGLDPNLLKKFDDKSLVELYNDSVKESGVKPDVLSQALVETSKLSPEEQKKVQETVRSQRLSAGQLASLKKLPFAELKVKLLETGYFDKKTLESVTEVQLRAALDQLTAN